jgi:hypothetical protein
MANSILTPLIITRESARVLHQKLNFLTQCNTQYDDRFAKTGAKAGTQLNIRLPSKYTTRTTATASYNDHVERSTPLVVASQYGVDVSFTSVELTMQLDEFRERFIEPAMATLAAKMESDALTAAYKLVPNYTGTTSTDMTYFQFQQNGQYMTEALVPGDNKRTAILTPRSRVNFGDAVKGLFQDDGELAKQYKEGRMGRTGGFDVYENTLIPTFTTGSCAGSILTTGNTNATVTTANSWVSQTDVSVTGATSATTLAAGDIVTFGTLADGYVDIHPETKTSYGRLKTFVVQTLVTMTTAANTYTVTVKPGIMTGSGNAYQNTSLTGADTSGLTVTNWGAASTAVGQSLFFHKDAFVFATADLEDVSQFGSWGARANVDGISMRIGKQWDIANDRIPCRIDVLWGFGGLYAADGFAVRHINKLT